MHMERDRTMEKQRFCSSCKAFYSPNGGYETGRIQDQNLRHNMGTQKTVCKGQGPRLYTSQETSKAATTCNNELSTNRKCGN